MTINNYDDRDLALVRQGYPDDIRKLVYTLEEGENGTPHIQAYIHMKRTVRFSHMRKLFPGANFGTQTSAEWRLNQHNYAQKLDGTARSPAVIQNNDPLHTVEGSLRRVVEAMINDYPEESIEEARDKVQRDMVIADYTMAKVFVSAVYKTMWKEFGHEIHQCLFRVRMERIEADTHTHTHAQEIKSRQGSITDGKDSEGRDDAEEPWGQDEESEGDEDSDGSSYEGHSESASSLVGSEDD